MKLMSKVVLANLLYLIILPAKAEDQGTNPWNNPSQNLAQYLQNLGGYLGYDVTQSPTANNQTVSQQLLSISTTQLAESYVYYTFFGALPVNTLSKALSQFLPTSISGATAINNLANSTFKYQNYSSASKDSQTLSVNSLIDQQTYQQDPVSQAVLNILGTPNYTYCMLYDLSAPSPNCQLLYQNQVMNNVIGSIPSPDAFFGYEYNQQLIGQLNSNSLMAPMLYSTEQAGQNTGSPTPKTTNPGLTSQNQIEEAANFIRYATAAVAPGTLPSIQTYTNLYSLAVPNGNNNVTQLQQMQAQATLSNYFTNLRIFAAQSSVGISNLYYILSKRLPQKQGTNSNTNEPLLSSQAMSEFNMATWRLFNPNMSANKQWVNQLNGASSATVEKEIATLLAEINYQMYLDRQIQERILLTNSIMLIQNTRSAQPSADLTNQSKSSTQ